MPAGHLKSDLYITPDPVYTFGKNGVYFLITLMLHVELDLVQTFKK